MPTYRFDDFAFDADLLRLERGGQPVAAQPRVLELLGYLIERRERMVSRGEMAEALWTGSFVSEDAITKRIGLLRKALGDTGKPSRYIQTIYGKGARFVGTLAEDAAQASPAAASVAAPSAMTHADQAPAIAVLPFRLDGKEGLLGETARGLPDDITSALVKLRSLRVIARGSAFRYASGNTPLADIRRDLGVGYALGGSVEPVENGLRVYAELVRTRDEGVVWSENYRIGLQEVHDLRDELVGRVVNGIDIAIPAEEAARATLKMPSQMDAWEAFHLGQSLGVETIAPDFPRAEVYLRKAVENAPGFTRAHAALAFVHWNFFTEKRDEERNRELMLVEAERALALDALDPMAHVAIAAMRGTLGDMDAGLTHVSRALDLAPNFARAHAAMAGFQTGRGQLAESLASVERAVSLSPRDPHLSRWLAIRLVNQCIVQDMDGVRATAGEIARTGSGQVSALGWALTGYSLCGDAEEAGKVATRLRKTLPGGKSQGIPGVYNGLPPMLQAMLAKAFADHDLVL